ncbi:carboxyl-terminal processing protease [Bradyrhizobium sp. USDA 4524]|uniref:S41 family peptidase n=1 Tax=unclassified Bradyrhizobium TaxID=2631580 RepID=UPI0020A17550|nr:MULTISPECIES: S41 family peptidase [unclassified Bradyrhizobium]MCP1845185.1 carboxyl-terminal processing protease [Bradyrhizobium sp. USDA 4538]MCP1905750.1 carboxyl-terminal processing protease [Bradyrhizobium sp. USDA 4537]MCP1988594.1 carboxyl-terminal processing protease [Bradyrhizobium sp. USDA 4539]
MKKVINSAPSRRHFLRLTSMAAASALTPTVLWAEHHEAADSATSQAVPARIATFEEVWRTVRDRFYDPHLHGLDWSAVRERYLPDATRASSEEALAGVINSMLSELHASHTRYYTPYEPEYYQLSDIFAGALRRRGLERVFPSGRISYPGIGVLSRLDMQGRSLITGVIEGTPAQQAGLFAGDVMVFADGAPFEPVQSFRGKVGKEVVLGLRRAGAFMQLSVTPVEIEPNKMFLDGLKASARIIPANGRRIGYVHVWCYAGSAYQRTLEHLLSQSPLNDADALIWDLRDGWGGAIPGYLDLFNTRAPTMRVTDRNGASELGNVKWRKPVAMLVNGGTRSGKEILAYGFKKYRLGEVIGSRTEGAVLAATAFLIDRGLLLLAVADVQVDGERLEGVGVAPTIEIQADPASMGLGDPQLNRAIAVLSVA